MGDITDFLLFLLWRPEIQLKLLIDECKLSSEL